MVPKIFEWIENAPINENLPKEKPVEEATEATADTADTATGSDTAGNETVTVDDELSAVFFDF